MRMRSGLLVFLLALIIGATLLPASQKVPARTVKIRVTAEQANLREKPDIGSSIVQQIPEGAVLEADKKEGEWYFVRYTLEDGGVIGGWIHESLAEVVEEAGPAPAAVTPPAPAAPRPAATGQARFRGSRADSFPLELAVSGGIGTLAPRDLNNGTRGFADWVSASVGLPATEPADILHAGLLADVELSYRLSPRLALGLGASALSARNGDKIVLTDQVLTETISTKPSITGGAVKLTARFYPGAGFYIRGALGVYSAKAGYRFRDEGDGSWEEWRGSATAAGLGGEAAFGGEWAVGKRTDVFVEAGFRMASFEELRGQNVYTNSEGERLTETGILYFFHKTAADENDYPLLAVRESPPAEAGVVDSRRARINLSGTAVRVGFRYRF
jgi:hypothetical protein